MQHILYCLLVLKVRAAGAMPTHFMSQFIIDMAEHYTPTSLTIVVDEGILEENVCSISTVYCIGYGEEKLHNMAGLIETFSDDSVLIFMRTIDTIQLENM